MNTVAEVSLWGSVIGYVAWDDKRQVGVFEYEPAFRRASIEVAPLLMPSNQRRPYFFLNLRGKTYHGLPGLLADSLPDKFGNALIAEWLARQGRAIDALNPVERLCYQGERGMGALEFRPAAKSDAKAKVVQVDELVRIASAVLADRQAVRGALDPADEKGTRDGLNNLLMVGTSAGGARAKCVIAFNEVTREVRSGQVGVPEGFTHWLLKLDGVGANGDKELCDPLGYGSIEYAYYQMALDCRIEMSPCLLLRENGRAHFMTRRFDRGARGEKLHMQSLCALMHLDFNEARAHSYEQACQAIRTICADPVHDLEQQFRRAVFNVIGRNQDDHTKNIAFLMDKRGKWRLSPAFDVAYSYNPDGQWTSRHQMLINGKSEEFVLADLLALASFADVRTAKAKIIIAETTAVFGNWLDYAARAGVFDEHRAGIKKTFRLTGLQ